LAQPNFPSPGGRDNPPIAVVVEKSLTAIVAILAVFKSGQAYMALEPDMTPARITEHLTNTRVQLVLTRRAYASRLMWSLPANVESLFIEDAPASEIPGADEWDENPRVSIPRNAPAIMNMTSGSTGVPKYVIHSHQNRLYFWWDLIHCYLFSHLDRHILFHDLSTSSAPISLFSCLLSGGTLYLVDSGQTSPSVLERTLNEYGITHVNIPTVVVRELLRNLEGEEALPSLRVLTFTGQSVFRHDLEKFQKHVNRGCILVCRYSMTELGGVSHFLADASTQLETHTVPVGYEYPGRKMLIVDEQGHLLPVDCVGEIAVYSDLPLFWDTLGLKRSPV
jgi:non-ribosomal peptide synthetase component F